MDGAAGRDWKWLSAGLEMTLRLEMRLEMTSGLAGATAAEEEEEAAAAEEEA